MFTPPRLCRALIVLAIRILETIHTAFCIQFAYAYLVRNFGNVVYFEQINWYVSPRCQATFD